MSEIITETVVEEPPAKSRTSTAIVDDNLTEQQRVRDRHTTELYKHFVEAYDDKRQFVGESKRIIRNWCIAWVSALVLACVGLSMYVIIFSSKSTGDVVALISAIVPIAATIFGTLNIVTKHVFPEDEEKNVTEIVKLIHENDLKNKQENLKQREDSHPKTDELTAKGRE